VSDTSNLRLPYLAAGAAQDLVITGQLANAGDTITLESYAVELLFGA
jgi:hypothetical protein